MRRLEKSYYRDDSFIKKSENEKWPTLFFSDPPEGGLDLVTNGQGAICFLFVV